MSPLNAGPEPKRRLPNRSIRIDLHGLMNSRRRLRRSALATCTNFLDGLASSAKVVDSSAPSGVTNPLRSPAGYEMRYTAPRVPRPPIDNVQVAGQRMHRERRRGQAEIAGRLQELLRCAFVRPALGFSATNQMRPKVQSARKTPPRYFSGKLPMAIARRRPSASRGPGRESAATTSMKYGGMRQVVACCGACQP